MLVRLRLRFSLFVKINLDIIHGFTISFPFRNLDIFLLEDAIVSSKTNPRAAAARIRREVMARNNEAKAETFSFISTLYLKQQTNILWCFSSLKFENSLFSNKRFRCIFAVRGRFIQLKTTKQSILFKTGFLKSNFSLCKLLLVLPPQITFL